MYAFCIGLPCRWRGICKSPRDVLISPHRAQSSGQMRVKTRTWRMTPVAGRRRERIDPSDEAFVTCPDCGSDALISATKLIESGTVRTSCEQCRGNWIARVEDGLTADGTSLLEDLVAKRENSEDGVPSAGKSDRVDGAAAVERATAVKLYVSGLGPKVDSSALREAIEIYGVVTSANVVYDKGTGRSRGFGFATIVGKSAAAAVMDDLSGSSELGTRVKVREAIE